MTSSEECPICYRSDAKLYDDPESFRTVAKCKVCGEFLIDDHAQQTLSQKPKWQLAGLVRRSNEFYPRRPADLTDYEVVFSRLESLPKSLADRCRYFIEVVCHRTRAFGEQIEFHTEFDYPLALASCSKEFEEIVNLLHDRSLLKRKRISTYEYPAGDGTAKYAVSATYDSFARVEETPMAQRSIFISSTCHDLLDARMELASHLEGDGHVVKLSDDPHRFNSTLQQGSIEVCLENLRTSDLVIVVLDRRYGPSLGEAYGNLSATHVEVNEAQRIRKPTFTFIRDQTLSELTNMKRHFRKHKTDPAETTRILDKERGRQESFLQLFDQLTGLKTDAPNWRTPFSSVVDLKKLVSKTVREFDMRL